MLKLIKRFDDFILNETLKTVEIDATFNQVSYEFNLLIHNYSISKSNNKIYIKLNNVDKIITGTFITLLDYVTTTLINRYGWFPATLRYINLMGMMRDMSYNEEYLLNNYMYLDNIEICFEPKYDKTTTQLKTLYHLSFSQHEDKILKNGLVPRAKSKLSNHTDRIYLCDNIKSCYNLIGRMKHEIKYDDTGKYKIPPKSNKDFHKWVIFEIDATDLEIDLYPDPNYKDGFYCVKSIPPNRIKVVDREEEKKPE
jgi:hypothetical protein